MSQPNKKKNFWLWLLWARPCVAFVMSATGRSFGNGTIQRPPMASGVNAIGPTVSIVWRFDQRCRDLSERTDDDLS